MEKETLGKKYPAAMTFRDMIVWQKAHAMVLEIYKMSRAFPTEERFGLVSQMRRAAVSVAANIAEGFAKKERRTRRDFTISRKVPLKKRNITCSLRRIWDTFRVSIKNKV